jgi:DNA repair protein RadC
MASKKQIESTVCEEGNWYWVPEYKVMLVRDSNGGAKATGKKKTLTTPDDVAEIFRTYLDGADRENFCIAMLDRKGNIIGINTVSIGSLSSSIVHPREVFKPAVILGANSLILCHNHPSGDTTPSKEDIEVTKRLVDAGKIMGIEILDHVIIGDSYTSMRSKGLF